MFGQFRLGFLYKSFAAFGAGYLYLAFSAGYTECVFAFGAFKETVVFTGLKLCYFVSYLCFDRPPEFYKFIILTASCGYVFGKHTKQRIEENYITYYCKYADVDYSAHKSNYNGGDEQCNIKLIGTVTTYHKIS